MSLPGLCSLCYTQFPIIFQQSQPPFLNRIFLNSSGPPLYTCMYDTHVHYLQSVVVSTEYSISTCHRTGSEKSGVEGLCLYINSMNTQTVFTFGTAWYTREYRVLIHQSPVEWQRSTMLLQFYSGACYQVPDIMVCVIRVRDVCYRYEVITGIESFERLVHQMCCSAHKTYFYQHLNRQLGPPLLLNFSHF